MTPNYSMLIQWSDEDQVFIVSLPEFGPYCHTHGNTYEEAAKMGQECLEGLIESFEAWGKPLPEPVKFPSSNAEVKQCEAVAGNVP